MKWLPSFNFWMKVTILWRKLNIGCAQPMWRFRLSGEVGARPRAIWLGGSACPGVIGRMGTFKSVPCEIYTGASTFGGISGGVPPRVLVLLLCGDCSALPSKSISGQIDCTRRQIRCSV